MERSNNRKTSVYSEQLMKDWSNCNAGFDDLTEWKKRVPSAKSRFLSSDWGHGSEEEEQEVEIVWSSSSEDEGEKVGTSSTKDVATLANPSLRKGAASVNPHKLDKGKSSANQKGQRPSSVGAKRGTTSLRTSALLRSQDAELADCISDSSSNSSGKSSPVIESCGSGSQDPDRTRTALLMRKVALKERTFKGESSPHLQKKNQSPTTSSAAKDTSARGTNFLLNRGKRKFQDIQEDSFEPEILDYESPDESTTNVIDNIAAASPICTSLSNLRALPTSTTATTISPRPHPPGSPAGGSEWLKKLRVQVHSVTPEKAKGGKAAPPSTSTGAACGDGRGNVESARKKKKFVRSGLAERLQRLLSREKSSLAMWQHRQSDSQSSESGENNKSALLVKVLSCENHTGIYVTQCLLQATEKEGQTGAASESVWVLFSRATGDELGLAAGMLVSIHPPWQRLAVPKVSKPVILCTYFCQAVTSNNDMNETSNLTLDPTQPFIPGDLVDEVESPKILQPVKLLSRMSRSSPILDALEHDVWKRGVLSSIMDSVGETGGCSSSGISFRARIQRIVTRRQRGQVQQQSGRLGSTSKGQETQQSISNVKSVLLQDYQNEVCELQLTNQTAESSTWQSIVQSGEGNSYIFRNLKVTQKVTRQRAAGLFSLIGSLQDDSQSASGQNVCYILTSEPGVTSAEALDQSETEVPPYRPPPVRLLSEICKHTSTTKPQRQSFQASVLHIAPTTQDIQPQSKPSQTQGSPTTSWLLFLSSPCLQQGQHTASGEEEDTSHGESHAGGEGYVCVHVHHSCVLPDGVLEGLLAGTGREVLCRDIVVRTSMEDGRGVGFSADGFSQIRLEAGALAGETPIHTSAPRLPTLTDTSRAHSLVTVTGHISGIEEESAFSWPACPQCGNNHLDGGEGSGSMLHCAVCNEDVPSPTTRMHLCAFLSCPQSQQCTIKVQLLQSTIESLLSSSTQSSGGYDLQSIMGVSVGPIICLVRSCLNRNFHLEEISLYES